MENFRKLLKNINCQKMAGLKLETDKFYQYYKSYLLYSANYKLTFLYFSVL